MTRSLSTAVDIVRAIAGVFLPVLALEGPLAPRPHDRRNAVKAGGSN